MAINYNTGISQYLAWGTTSSPSTYCGRIIGGELFSDANRSWEGSVGGKHHTLRGIWRGGGRAEIEPTSDLDSYNLLTKFQRSSWTNPALTLVSFAGGCTLPTSGARGAFKQLNAAESGAGCYINTLSAECAMGQFLRCTLEWEAFNQAVDASPAMPTPTGSPWAWFHGTCNLNDLTLYLQRISFSATNNLEPLSSVESKSANSLVLPEDFKIGNEVVTCTMEALQFPGTNYWELQNDTDVTALTATIGVTSGSAVLTFTLNNLAIDSMRQAFQGSDGTVTWAITASTEPNAATSLAISQSGLS